MVNMSKRQRQTHRDEKCHAKDIHASSMYDNKTLTPQDRQQLAKQHNTQVQRKSCQCILQQRKRKLTET